MQKVQKLQKVNTCRGFATFACFASNAKLCIGGRTAHLWQHGGSAAEQDQEAGRGQPLGGQQQDGPQQNGGQGVNDANAAGGQPPLLDCSQEKTFPAQPSSEFCSADTGMPITSPGQPQKYKTQSQLCDQSSKSEPEKSESEKSESEERSGLSGSESLSGSNASYEPSEAEGSEQESLESEELSEGSEEEFSSGSQLEYSLSALEQSEDEELDEELESEVQAILSLPAPSADGPPAYERQPSEAEKSAAVADLVRLYQNHPQYDPKHPCTDPADDPLAPWTVTHLLPDPDDYPDFFKNLTECDGWPAYRCWLRRCGKRALQTMCGSHGSGVLQGRKAQLSKNVVFLLNQVMLAGWDFT